MKKDYLNLEIDIVYFKGDVVTLSGNPFDGGDVSIGDMVIGENMFE